MLLTELENLLRDLRKKDTRESAENTAALAMFHMERLLELLIEKEKKQNPPECRGGSCLSPYS